MGFSFVFACLFVGWFDDIDYDDEVDDDNGDGDEVDDDDDAGDDKHGELLCVVGGGGEEESDNHLGKLDSIAVLLFYCLGQPSQVPRPSVNNTVSWGT